MGGARPRTILALELLAARLQQDVLVAYAGLLHQVVVVPALAGLQYGVSEALDGLLLLPGDHLTVVRGLPMFLSSLIIPGGFTVLRLVALLVDLLHRRLYHFGPRRVQIILLRTVVVVSRYAHVADPRC